MAKLQEWQEALVEEVLSAIEERRATTGEEVQAVYMAKMKDLGVPGHTRGGLASWLRRQKKVNALMETMGISWPPKPPVSPQVLRPLPPEVRLGTSLGELLSGRVANAFKHEGIDTLKALMYRIEKEGVEGLLTIHNFGQKSLAEVKLLLEALEERGDLPFPAKPAPPSRETLLAKVPGFDSATVHVLGQLEPPLITVGDILARLAQVGLAGLADLLHSEDMARAIHAVLEEVGFEVLLPEEAKVADLPLGDRLKTRLISHRFNTVKDVLAPTPKALAHALGVGLRDLIPIYNAIQAAGFPVPEVPPLEGELAEVARVTKGAAWYEADVFELELQVPKEEEEPLEVEIRHKGQKRLLLIGRKIFVRLEG